MAVVIVAVIIGDPAFHAGAGYTHHRYARTHG